MSKRKLLLPILIFVALMCMILAGCSIGPLSPEKTRDKYDLTSKVVYYANGGSFQNHNATLELEYRGGDSVLNVGFVKPTSGTIEITLSDHTLVGWYYATLDENGQPVFESDADRAAGRCQYDESREAKFPLVIESNSTVYLVAVWRMNVKMNFYLADPDDDLGTLTAGETQYSKGDLLLTQSFNVTDGRGYLAESLRTLFTGCTYVACYAEPECETVLEFPIKNTDYDETCDIYVRYLKGEWTIVDTASKFSSMLGQTEGNYFLYKDIDCRSAGLTIIGDKTFNGTIVGNGCKITNLNATTTLNQLSDTKDTYSLFGRLGSEARISGLTIEASFTYLVQHSKHANLGIYALMTEAAAGAQVENVTLTATLKLTTYYQDTVLYHGAYGAGCESAFVGNTVEVILDDQIA